LEITFCRAGRLALPIALAALTAAPLAQEAVDPQARVRDVQPLVRAVFAAIRGTLHDVRAPLGWSHAFFKGEAGNTYVPFTVTFDRESVPRTLVMYVFVTPARASKGQVQSSAGAEGDEPQIAPPPETAFEATYVLDPGAGASPAVRVSRAFSVPPGEYDVYVAAGPALTDKSAVEGGAGGTPPSGILLSKQQLSVPNLWTAALSTSTILVADRVEPLKAALTLEQQIANPYSLSGWQIVPASSTDFTQADDLSVFFFVYNAGVTPARKPDLTVEYAFHRRSGGRHALFTRTAPQQFNASTMPGFSVEAGHQIIGGQAVPLRSFPAGEYRLEVKVVDRTNGSSIDRTVDFSVSE
jgi:hypothetical protein